MSTTEAVKSIANGHEPAWTETFDHPVHGPLTFTVPTMPKNRDWIAHSVIQEQLAPGVIGASAHLPAAVAAMQTFMKVPNIREDRIEDPNDPSHVKFETEAYDPLDDDDPGFPMLVWLTWFAWRGELLAPTSGTDLKNGSGATSPAVSAEPSPAPTALTPAS